MYFQKAKTERCFQVPHPVVLCSHWYAVGVCNWDRQDWKLWRLCDCVGVDPLLHSGGCDVDGGGGLVHVPEDCHCVCRDLLPPLHCYSISYLLG